MGALNQHAIFLYITKAFICIPQLEIWDNAYKARDVTINHFPPFSTVFTHNVMHKEQLEVFEPSANINLENCLKILIKNTLKCPKNLLVKTNKRTPSKTIVWSFGMMEVCRYTAVCPSQSKSQVKTKLWCQSTYWGKKLGVCNGTLSTAQMVCVSNLA